MLIHIQPIYGNGWTDGHSSVIEPSPFDIDAQHRDDGQIQGFIVSLGHPLHGGQFEATPRHLESDTLFNCDIRCLDGSTLKGYCKIS